MDASGTRQTSFRLNRLNDDSSHWWNLAVLLKQFFHPCQAAIFFRTIFPRVVLNSKETRGATFLQFYAPINLCMHISLQVGRSVWETGQLASRRQEGQVCEWALSEWAKGILSWKKKQGEKRKLKRRRAAKGEREVRSGIDDARCRVTLLKHKLAQSASMKGTHKRHDTEFGAPWLLKRRNIAEVHTQWCTKLLATCS